MTRVAPAINRRCGSGYEADRTPTRTRTRIGGSAPRRTGCRGGRGGRSSGFTLRCAETVSTKPRPAQPSRRHGIEERRSRARPLAKIIVVAHDREALGMLRYSQTKRTPVPDKLGSAKKKKKKFVGDPERRGSAAPRARPLHGRALRTHVVPLARADCVGCGPRRLRVAWPAAHDLVAL